MSKIKKSIQSAMNALEKRFGEPVVIRMGDSANTNIKTFSSGRADLDTALGGGYGVGKIIEIYAESGAGKTGLALEAAKVVQDNGGIIAIIDAEHALNTEYCELIGLNVDDLFISQPSFGEQVIETMRSLIQTGDVDLIIVDSVAAMVPRAELEGESGEAKIALQARLMSQGMKLITAPASDNNCTIIFINQLRSTIAQYGPSSTTSGGRALRFYATQRLEVKNKGRLTDKDEVIGFKQHIKIVKNKIGPPFKEIENNIIYGKGVDEILGLMESLVFEEVIIKKGNTYTYKDAKLGIGKSKLLACLNENPDMVDDMKEELKLKLNH